MDVTEASSPIFFCKSAHMDKCRSNDNDFGDAGNLIKRERKYRFDLS